MTATYRIKDWQEVFESAASRKLVGPRKYVMLPINFGGLAYSRLMAMDDGPTIYGAFMVLCQVAANCPTKGVLADENGALNASDIALKTRFPLKTLERAIEVLSDSHHKIGWLEEVAEVNSTRKKPNKTDKPKPRHDAGAATQDGGASRHDAGLTHPINEIELEENRNEIKETEEKRSGSEISIAGASGSDSGQSQADDDGEEPPERRMARMKFRLECAKVWAKPGQKTRSGGGDQRLSDDTSTTRLFDLHVWPDGLAPPDAVPRVEKAMDLAAQAAKRPNPMGWLTKVVKKFNVI